MEVLDVIATIIFAGLLCLHVFGILMRRYRAISLFVGFGAACVR